MLDFEYYSRLLKLKKHAPGTAAPSRLGMAGFGPALKNNVTSCIVKVWISYDWNEVRDTYLIKNIKDLFTQADLVLDKHVADLTTIVSHKCVLTHRICLKE